MVIESITIIIVWVVKILPILNNNKLKIEGLDLIIWQEQELEAM